MKAEFRQPLMKLIVNFSIYMWEWFLYSSVLEQTESDLLKINWLRDVILLLPIVLVPWGRFPLYHTPIKPISTFRDQILFFVVGCVTTWLRGSHHIPKCKNVFLWTEKYNNNYIITIHSESCQELKWIIDATFF